jgi:hypothetical protein
MDLNRVAQVIGHLLKNPSDLRSLQIQNHIYGCFVVLEDIASTDNTVIGTTIRYHDCTFDYDKDFTKIGVQYGFLPDLALLLPLNVDYMAHYKTALLGLFNYISGAKNIALVDTIEEKLFLILSALVPDDLAFFQNATSTGELDERFIKMAENIIRAANTANNAISTANNAISTANNAISTSENAEIITNKTDDILISALSETHSREEQVVTDVSNIVTSLDKIIDNITNTIERAENITPIVRNEIVTPAKYDPPPPPLKSILRVRIDKPMRRTRKTRIRNITPIQRRKRIAYTRKRNKN